MMCDSFEKLSQETVPDLTNHNLNSTIKSSNSSPLSSTSTSKLFTLKNSITTIINVITVYLPSIPIGFILGTDYVNPLIPCTLLHVSIPIINIFSALLLNYIGRRIAFFISVFLLSFAICLKCFEVDSILLQILDGIAIANYLTFATVYIPEILHKKYRGIFVYLFHVILNSVLFIRIKADSYFEEINLLFCIFCLMTLVIAFSLSMYTIAESPFINANRNVQKAWTEFQKLRTGEIEKKKYEMQDIVYEVIGHGKKLHCCSLIGYQETAERCLFIFGGSFINSMLLGGNPLFGIVTIQQNKTSEGDRNWLLRTSSALSFFIASILLLCFIDSFGRRCVAITSGSILLCYQLICLIIYNLTQEDTLETFLEFCHCGFLLGYFMGTSYCMYLIMGEIFPYPMRAVGTSLGVSFIFIFEVIGRYIHFLILKNINALSVYFGFGAFVAAIYLALMLLLLPETKNMSLYRIQIEMDRF